MFKNLAVAHRILALMLAGGMLLFAVAFIGWQGMKTMTHSLDTVYQDRAVPMRDLARMQMLLQKNLTEILLAYQHDPNSPAAHLHDHPIEMHLEAFVERRKEINKLWNDYTATLLTDEEKALVADFETQRQAWLVACQPAFGKLAAHDFEKEALVGFLNERKKSGEAALTTLGNLIQLQAKVAKNEYEQGHALYQRNQMLFLGLIVGGLSLTGLFAFFLIRSITHPLKQAVELAEAVAQGDLSHPIDSGARNEVGRLLNAMACMQEGLKEMVRANQHHALRLGDAARALSASASEVARASEEQSEAASGMAASVEEMSVSIDQVGDHAREAHAQSLHSGEQSREGGEVVHSAANEIGRIADAVNTSASSIRELEGYSNEISAIVGVIREIADQTNLLALNAAIEAARAGEQGRGFAVVADEVRKLAERTANSTQQIAGMIDKVQNGARRAVSEMEAGVTRVGEGVQLAHRAGDSIVGIQEGAARVVNVVDDIAAALREQSIAAQSLAGGVERIAQMAEKNSAAVGRTADSAREMEALAGELGASVARFRV